MTGHKKFHVTYLTKGGRIYYHWLDQYGSLASTESEMHNIISREIASGEKPFAFVDDAAQPLAGGAMLRSDEIEAFRVRLVD